MIEKILKAYEDMAKALPRMDRIQKTFATSSELQHILALIYSDIIEFHRRAYKMFRRKAWHLWFAFDWGLFQRRFEFVISRLASHCDLLDKEAASIHFMEMKTWTDKRFDEEEATEQYRQNQMAKDVFAWLSVAEADQEEYLCRLSDQRLPETCSFIFDDPSIGCWAGGEGGLEVVSLNAYSSSSLSMFHLQRQDLVRKRLFEKPILHLHTQPRTVGLTPELLIALDDRYPWWRQELHMLFHNPTFTLTKWTVPFILFLRPQIVGG